MSAMFAGAKALMGKQKGHVVVHGAVRGNFEFATCT